jgi:hypothetical protein
MRMSCLYAPTSHTYPNVHHQGGYRSRLLPIVMPTCQPYPPESEGPVLNTEPVLIDVDQPANTLRLTHWHIAETLPEDLEYQTRGDLLEPTGHKLRDTIRKATNRDTGAIYTPLSYPDTATNKEQRRYQGDLLPVMTALEYLEGNAEYQYIVKIGWEAIARRIAKDR